MSLTRLFDNHPPLILAPMAGLSDLAMRQLVREFGADLTISEMISSNALVHESAKSFTMLRKAPNEQPFIAQIAGSDLEVIKKAVHILNDAGVDGIDFNCGCPVNKVIKQNAGSALLKDLDHLRAILGLICRENATGFTSVKIRLGFERPDIERIMSALSGCPINMLTIHARTRAGMYSAPVDYEQIALAKRLAPELKIIANGDIDDKNADSVLEQTRADGLMIGRKAIGAPWIFAAIKGKSALKDEQKIKIIKRHFELMCELYGQHACAMFRKHFHEYSKGAQNASALRSQSNQITDKEQMIELIESLNYKEKS